MGGCPEAVHQPSSYFSICCVNAAARRLRLVYGNPFREGADIDCLDRARFDSSRDVRACATAHQQARSERGSFPSTPCIRSRTVAPRHAPDADADRQPTSVTMPKSAGVAVGRTSASPSTRPDYGSHRATARGSSHHHDALRKTTSPADGRHLGVAEDHSKISASLLVAS